MKKNDITYETNMSQLIKFPVNITCGCGAKIDTYRYSPTDALKTEKQFLDAHEACNEKSVFEQVFGKPDDINTS